MDVQSKKSNKSFIKDEELENYIVVPPDGGWGWIVVAAAFSCNVISDGISYSFGLFLNDLSREFNVSVGRITIVQSLQTFFYFLAGPFVSALLNRFGFRFVAIMGSVIASIGFAVGATCNNYYVFIVFSGVLGGLGFGMISIPTVIICGFYFEKWRALATGIATCGSGIGTLIMPPFITYLLQEFSWRKTYYFIAVIILLTALLSILYKPLHPVRVVQDETEIQIIQQADSIGTFYMDTYKTNKCFGWLDCRRHHNNNYPTTAELVPVETVIFAIPDKGDDRSSLSYQTYATATIVTNYTSTQNTQVFPIESRVRQPLKRCAKCVRCCRNCCIVITCGRCMTYSRPMYRDDIFFAHSLMLLPQYKESIASQRKRKQKMKQTQTNLRGLPKPNSTGYHMSVTRVTTHREIYGTTDACCKCSIAVLRTLSTMLDLRLLKSPAFQMFSWTGMFIVLGYYIPYIYIKERGVAHGIPPEKAFWLLSAIGAANTTGRIISGILPSLTNIKVIEYSWCCMLVAGISSILSTFCFKEECQFAYACVYGLAGSCIASLRPIIVVELFGLENLTNAFGLQLMFMAVAGLLGTMIAGILYDQTGNYNYTFYLAGSCVILAAFMLMTVRKIRQIEKKRNWCDI